MWDDATRNEREQRRSLANRIIGAESEDDPYDYFSAQNQTDPEYASQAEANKAAHHAGTDILPDVRLSESDDGFRVITQEQKKHTS